MKLRQLKHAASSAKEIQLLCIENEFKVTDVIKYANLTQKL